MEIHAIRLKALRREVDKFPTLAAFARHYRLDTTYISQLLNGHRNLGEKAARNLEAKIGWTPMFMDWEPDLEAEMLDPTPAPTTRLKGVPDTELSAGKRIPLISFVQAGLWREAVDPYAQGAGEEYLVTHQGLGSHAFALTVRGESMLPEFREGDTLIIDPDVKPLPGDYVVAKNGAEEATFKKYRPRGLNERGENVIELVPLNEDFPTLRSDVTPIQVIGTLMEHRRYRRRK